jgi:hypothetical protein
MLSSSTAITGTVSVIKVSCQICPLFGRATSPARYKSHFNSLAPQRSNSAAYCAPMHPLRFARRNTVQPDEILPAEPRMASRLHQDTSRGAATSAPPG